MTGWEKGSASRGLRAVAAQSSVPPVTQSGEGQVPGGGLGAT